MPGGSIVIVLEEISNGANVKDEVLLHASKYFGSISYRVGTDYDTIEEESKIREPVLGYMKDKGGLGNGGATLSTTSSTDSTSDDIYSDVENPPSSVTGGTGDTSSSSTTTSTS